MMSSAITNGHVCVCQLREGCVVTTVQRGEDSAVSRVDDVTVSDGQWHHVLLELRGPALGAITAALSLDHGLYTVRHVTFTDEGRHVTVNHMTRLCVCVCL